VKQRPILFQGAMVRALLNGSKTQTRRIFKAKNGGVWPNRNDMPGMRQIMRNCPYGKPGDQIQVRETFFALGRWETRFSAKNGRDEWHFVDMTLETGHAYSYVADGAVPALLAGKRDGGVTPKWWKRPAIFMPLVASRITLEITGVRVERLQDISEADAKAEGLRHYREKGIAPDLYCNGITDGFIFPVDAYSALWESINGPGSWDANPWVWVVEFKRVSAL